MYLGFDTSGPISTFVLIREDGSVLASRIFAGHRGLSQRFYGELDQLFADGGLTIADVAGFTVTTGPGSFTGLRVGMTTAKTMAQASGKPLVGVGTFECFGAEFQSPEFGTVVPVTHSRRDEVYAAVYQNGQCLRAPFAAAPSALRQMIFDYSERGNITVVGSPALIEQGDCFASVAAECIPVQSFARLAAQRFSAGETVSYLSLVPEYVVAPTITKPKTVFNNQQ